MMSSAPPVVEAHGLTKQYGDLVAVDKLDLTIRQGELFGLIGPDGAGKTSIFNMLGGILDPSAGTLRVLDMEPRDARLHIGYLTQLFSLYLDLTIEQNLQYASGLRSVPAEEFIERRDHYLELMDLKRFSSRLAGNLSGGMKQKLALCCALIGRPRLLLLDEPTTGVDPVSRRDFWDVLATIAHEGVTIAVATPYLDEAERCSRIALLHKGIVKELGSPMELKERLGMRRFELRGAPLPDTENVLNTTAELAPLLCDTQEFGDRLDVLVQDVTQSMASISKAAEERHLPLTLSEQDPTLENVFVLTIKRSETPKELRPFNFTSYDRADGIAIEAVNLSKDFGTFKAVNNVNVKVAYGQIFGLLGANGAGKTTTIKMLCGLLDASSGQMRLGGVSQNLKDPRLRSKIGYMSQKFTLYEDLTVMENLRFYGGVYQVPYDLMDQRIKWVLETCDLSGRENMLTAQLPGGFRQRLAFGATVLHQPEILFLDEPTSGVDPLARRQLWSLISDFARHGTAVLITTHFLEEAEHCHELGFMVSGELVASGTPAEIKESQPGQLVEIRTNDNQRALDLLHQRMPRWQTSIFGDALHVVAETPEQEQQTIEHLKQSGVTISTTRTIPFSLEDAFIGIVERSKDGAESEAAA